MFKDNCQFKLRTGRRKGQHRLWFSGVHREPLTFGSGSIRSTLKNNRYFDGLPCVATTPSVSREWAHVATNKIRSRPKKSKNDPLKFTRSVIFQDSHVKDRIFQLDFQTFKETGYTTASYSASDYRLPCAGFFALCYTTTPTASN